MTARRLDRRRIVLIAGACALAAVLVVGVATILLLDRGGSPAALPPPDDALSPDATLAPRIVLFGDTVSARVDVVVDRARVDPDGVRVAWDPAPWRFVRPPERTVEEAGGSAHVRTSYVLRCLTRECAPARPTEEVTFSAASVSYLAEGAGLSRESVPWPALLVHSRVGSLDSGQRDVLAAPWRADFVTLPAVTYRISPAIALGALIALACVLYGLGALLTYRAWPRAEPKPEPPPPPPPVASPLEQALLLLERPVAANGSESRRRALELVADEVERLGDTDLALAARALAWSPHVPEIGATRVLASQLRERLEGNGARP